MRGLRCTLLTDQPATAEIGVTLAQASQGKGLATEALTAVVTELFEQLGMHRVFAEADDRNVPVRRLLERLGFRCEARPSRGRLVQGRVVDAASLRDAEPGVARAALTSVDFW